MTKGTFANPYTNPSVFVYSESDWDAVKGCVDMENASLYIMCQNRQSSAKVAFMVVVERKDEGILSSDITDKDGRFITEKTCSSK